MQNGRKSCAGGRTILYGCNLLAPSINGWWRTVQRTTMDDHDDLYAIVSIIEKKKRWCAILNANYTEQRLLTLRIEREREYKPQKIIIVCSSLVTIIFSIRVIIHLIF